MLQLFRNKRFLKVFSAFFALHLTLDWIFPTGSYALSSGPAMPEFSSFEPVGTSELVNVSTGDFVYNIPLLDVEGYPINLAYHSGVSMDQEASMVGLGWTLNLGAVNRTVRGLPDDFAGDLIKQERNLRPNISAGAVLNLGGEGAGAPILTLKGSLGVNWNNYKGYGMEFGIGFTSNPEKLGEKGILDGIGYGLSLSYDSDGGIGLNPSVSFMSNITKRADADQHFSALSVSAAYNSRVGLQSLTLTTDFGAYQKTPSGKTVVNQSAFGGSMISFATPTYSPNADFPFVSTNHSYYGTFGAEFFWADGFGGVTGYYGEQSYLYNERAYEAFGYLSAEGAKGRNDVLMDFNRHSDMDFIPGATKNLAVTQQTYDMYMATGQGMIGQFRAHRSDLPLVHDPTVVNSSNSEHISAQGALVINIFDVGGNINFISSQSRTGKWEGTSAPNELEESVGYVSPNSVTLGSEGADPLYEPAYFKQVGELTPVSDEAFLSSIGGTKAVSPKLSGISEHAKTNSYLVTKSGDVLTPEHHRTERDIRHTVFQALTAAEAAQFGLEKELTSYDHGFVLDDLDQFYDSNGNLTDVDQTTMARNAGLRQDHHVSEISVIRQDGSRYFYGLPAYNWKLREATFNVSGNALLCDDGLVEYIADTSNSVLNTSGIDHYFSATETPAYPYAHLLTAVVSPEYVDSDGVEGPSDGDLGSWHKFNYWNAAEEMAWRTPVDLDADSATAPNPLASYNRGFFSDPDDDKGSYTYGTKEVYYVHSVESKHYVAVFHYSGRSDNHPTNSENGGGYSMSNPLQRLDSLSLYAKEELRAYAQNSSYDLKPIKQVHFSYASELVPNTPNSKSSQQGKLTLKEVSFSYGNSEEARFSPYKFYYADPDHDLSINPKYNPEYHIKGYDRWGTYSPPCQSYDSDCNCTESGKIDNPEFPYTDQRQVSDTSWNTAEDPDFRYADGYAQVWALHTIITPSGAQINVDYESDDYAYVQDKAAMQMVTLKGFSDTPTGTPEEALYKRNGNDWVNLNYLIIDLPENFSFHPEISVGEREEYFKEVMLSGLGDWLYVNVYTNLNRSNSSTGYPELYEYVPTWVELDIESSGLINPSGTPTQAYLKIVPQVMKDKKKSGKLIQGVAQSAINFLWLNRPRIVTNAANTNATEDKLIQGLVGFANDFDAIFQGRMKALRNDEYCREIDASRSWVRLRNPDGLKHGGGLRVSRISMGDRWDEMTSSGYSEKTYGQTYTYTTEEAVPGMPGYKRTISSGVAAYEPILGGDENPFREPREVRKEYVAAMDERHFLLMPIAESLYPGPQIIYSRVKVANLTDEEVNRHGSGYVEHEFYTAKDYPTFFEEIPLKEIDVNSDKIIWKLVNQKKGATAVQGYAIRRNDMHGKPKAKSVYAQGQSAPISSMRYFYRTKGKILGYREGARNELDNTNIPVLTPEGKLDSMTIGQTIDLVFDSRLVTSTNIGNDLRINTNTSLLFPLLPPFPIPALFIPTVRSSSFFRAMSATKVVDSYGILERVEAYDLGALVATNNTAWDAVTGEVLLTNTYNEFEDPRHQFSYPAHWMYEGMGPAYQNLHAQFTDLDLSNVPTEFEGMFVPGDEIYWENGTDSGIGWVLDISGTVVSIVDDSGQLIEDSNGVIDEVESLVIFRSGRRNLSTSPVGGIYSQESPLVDDGQGGKEINPDGTLKILNASALEFEEQKKWVAPRETAIDTCIFSITTPAPATFIYLPPELSGCATLEDTVNPYFLGMRGAWYAGTSYSYLTERGFETAASPKYNYIRTKGFLADFSPFWVAPASSSAPWTTASTNWTFTEEASLVGSVGGPLESMNALDIYASVQQGYKSSVPVATAANSRYQEMAFDGFEDYDLEVPGCQDRHWPLQVLGSSVKNRLSTEHHHSGAKSLKIISGEHLYSIQPFTSGNCGSLGGGVPYELDGCDLSGTYAPLLPSQTGGSSKHVVSFWVLAGGEINEFLWDGPYSGYFDFRAFGRKSNGTNVSFPHTVSYSPIIEGWQRVEIVIEIVDTGFAVGDSWCFAIQSNDERGIYIDDIRAHPFNAMMTSYVYDAESMRLKAVLDENNFTRFYQYNDKGELVSVKVETEDGLKTVEEARYHTAKSP